MKYLSILSLMTCLHLWANGQTPQLLNDIYKPTNHPFEYLGGPFHSIQNKVLFYGLTFDQGYGFWTYDGNGAAIRVSDYGSSTANLAETANGFFFIYAYDVAKYSLYKLGGTPGVTLLIDDITSISPNNVPSIAALNGKVFYPDWGETTGHELWCASDFAGSAALVIDGTPGLGGTSPTELTKADSLIYYRGGGTQGGTQGRQLWRSDGTAAGTFKLLQVVPANQNIQTNSLRTLGNKAYFLIRKTSGETEFWVSDGTVSGTIKLTDVPSSYAVLDRFEAFFMDGKYVYLAIDPQSSEVKWAVTDGTPAGSELLLNLPTNTHFDLSFYDSKTYKSVLNGSFYFFCRNDSTTEYELWKSDGTSIGTQKVKSLGSSSSPQTLASSKYLFFFLAQNKGNNDIELWSSDGTAAGTKIIKSLGISENYLYFGSGEATDSTVLFKSPFYGPGASGFPYRSDGTKQGTYPVEGEPALYLAGSSPRGFVSSSNEAIFFRAFDNQFCGIWRSEPASPFATTRIDTLSAYTYFENATPMAAFDKVLWFSDEKTLSVTDETGTITQIQVPVTFGGYWANGPDGAVFFMGDNGQSLWRTDGTIVGTYEVLSAPSNTVFYDLLTIGDSLYFLQRIQVPNQPQYLWSSDGTAIGTHNVGTLIDGSTLFLREVAGRLAYSTSEYNPYSRTLFVKGYPSIFFEGHFDGDFAGLAIADSVLFVLGSKTYNPTDSLYYPFWVIENGTPTLLQKFKALAGHTPYNFGNTNSRLQSLHEKTIFGAGLSTDDVELWTSDGTNAGTYRLRDLNPSGSSNPDNFVRYNDQLWLFTANDGAEVAWWATDGTGSGTFKVSALATVKDYFVPNIEHAYLSGNRLFFSMNDGIIGQEPWVMVLEDSLVVSTIAPLLQVNELSIWPNPTKGFVNLTLESEFGKPVWIELINNTGQLVYKQKHDLPNTGPLSIPLSQQNKGVHFLQITTENGKIRTKKLIIAE